MTIMPTANLPGVAWYLELSNQAKYNSTTSAAEDINKAYDDDPYDTPERIA